MTDSAGLWANMLGLGPVLQAVNDPSFHAQVAGFVASVTDVQQRVARIEAKLDFIITKVMQNAALPVAVSFVELGPDGTGAHTATGGVTDDGTGVSGASVNSAGGSVRTLRADGINGAAGT